MDSIVWICTQLYQLILRILYSRVYTVPEDFGAKGDGVTDDTVAITKALDAMKEGSILYFAPWKTYYFTEVTIKKDYTKVTGGKLNGTITIDAEYVSIYGIRTISELPLKLIWSRNIEIYSNRFVNSDKAIYIPAINSNTQTTHTNTNVYNDKLFHANSKANIHGNLFKDVNYAIYVDYYTGEDDTVVASYRWMRTNDWHFVNNYVQDGLITSIYIKGIDGFVVTGNTFFCKGGSTIKEQVIKIDKADWLDISNNTFFEAGYESVLLGETAGVIIVNNYFGWCGTREQRSTIKFTTQGIRTQLTATGNIFSECTGHSIEFAYGYEAGKNTFGIVTGNTAILQDHYDNFPVVADKYLVKCSGSLDKIQCKNNAVYGSLYSGIYTYGVVPLIGELMPRRFYQESATVIMEIDYNSTKTFPLTIKGCYNDTDFWQSNLVLKGPSYASFENLDTNYGVVTATYADRILTLTLTSLQTSMIIVECPFSISIKNSGMEV